MLVMAHGGSPEWDAAVGEAVAPLRDAVPTALALGMADPRTMQAALDSLAQQGVTRVAVVRLFLSGASFLHQTEYLLGLRDDPPANPMLHHGGGDGGMHHGGMLHPLRHDMEIRLSREGLGDSPMAGRIMVARAAEHAGARVMLLAHGMGDEEENAAVLQAMSVPADELKRRGFTDVQVATLREDWPEARVKAEEEIRTWVGKGAAKGAPTVVVPFRLFGFGPYAEVLADHAYQATEGLLPHPLVTRWMGEQAQTLLAAP